MGVAGLDSTPWMSGLGKNNVRGADPADSVWIVGNPEVITRPVLSSGWRVIRPESESDLSCRGLSMQLPGYVSVLLSVMGL